MANETVSEVLAQSNTKTPDFMAPVLAQDMGITRTREHSSMPQEARREVPDPITISELVEGADEAVGDFVPGWGDYKTLEELKASLPDALRSYEGLERSGTLAAAAALGLVPGAGDYASKLLKRAAKKEPIKSAAEPSLNLTQKETDFFDEFLDSPADRYALQEEVPSLVVENGVLTVSPVDVDALEDWIMDGIIADGALSVPPRLRKGDVFNRFARDVSSFQEGGIVLPNPPKPDVSQAKRQAIGHQRALEAAIAQGRPPPGEEWPDEKYLATSELLERAVLPGGERDPLLNPDRPRTVDGEPVPVTDAEYMMREAGRFPNRQNPLALIGRDATLEKTATADMSETAGYGFSVDPGGAYEDLPAAMRQLIRESDRPELVDDPGGSIVTAAETFDEEFGPQVIVEGTLDHERMHAGLDVIREADPDFELPQFPSKYAGNFSDKLNEEMWVRVIHAHTEDLSAVPTTTDLVIDGEVQFDDNGSVKLTETNKKEKYDEILLHFTGGNTDYWLSQPSAIRGINLILEKAHEVGRELGSFDVTETPSDRAQFAPGGQRRYEGTEISARQPFQEGGIASLPNNPVLGGQQHMLAYITPEEASRLRAQGGGVTPTGGQYRGPGGIASFQVAGLAGIGQMGGVHGGGGQGVGHGQGVAAAQAAAAANAQAEAAAQTGLATGEGYLFTDAERERINPKTLAAIEADPIGAEDGGLLGLVQNALADGYVDITTHGLMDSTFGHVTALTPNMPANTFAGDRINVGDPNSAFGRAVMGLGTTALGMMNPALALPTMAIDIASSLSPGRSTGLMSLLGIPGMMNVVGKELGLGETPVGDVKGYMGDVAGYIGEKTGLSDIDFGAATKSLGLSGEPSPYTGRPLNLGPGISLPPPAGIPSVEIGLPVPPTTVTETLEDATSSFYDAQRLADATGVTLAQAEEYLASRYA